MSEQGEKKPDTLCILCAHSCTNMCSWEDDYEPVPGWTAEKTRQGYLVLQCPLYVKDTYETIKPQKIDSCGMDNILMAIGRQLREDYVSGRGGPYDNYNLNRKREERKSGAEIRRMNRKAIEEWMRGPIGGKLLQLSDTEEVIRMLQKLAKRYETDLMSLMR